MSESSSTDHLDDLIEDDGLSIVRHKDDLVCGEALVEVVSVESGKHKQKKVRFFWTREIQAKFREVIDMVGIEAAKPQMFLDHMKVPGLRKDIVRSHLQKYRAKLQATRDDTEAALGALGMLSGQDEMWCKTLCERATAQGVIPSNTGTETPSQMMLTAPSKTWSKTLVLPKAVGSTSSTSFKPLVLLEYGHANAALAKGVASPLLSAGLSAAQLNGSAPIAPFITQLNGSAPIAPFMADSPATATATAPATAPATAACTAQASTDYVPAHGTHAAACAASYCAAAAGQHHGTHGTQSRSCAPATDAHTPALTAYYAPTMAPAADTFAPAMAPAPDTFAPASATYAPPAAYHYNATAPDGYMPSAPNMAPAAALLAQMPGPERLWLPMGPDVNKECERPLPAGSLDAKAAAPAKTRPSQRRPVNLGGAAKNPSNPTRVKWRVCIFYEAPSKRACPGGATGGASGGASVEAP
jgi:SHAQKYF class myb-like DNA-binding protein